MLIILISPTLVKRFFSDFCKEIQIASPPFLCYKRTILSNKYLTGELR